MDFFRKVFIAIAILILSSCASKDLVEDKSRSKDLVEAFDLKTDPDFKKFAQVEVKKSSEKKLKPKKKITRRKKVSRKKKIKTKKKTKAFVEKKVPQAQKVEASVVLKEEKEDVVPFDPTKDPKYPTNYLRYNKVYAKYWDKYRPIFSAGEKMKLEVSWSIFKAGIAEIETLGGLEIDGTEVYGFRAEVASAEYFEKIYKLKDTLTTYVTKDEFIPLKFVLKQRESGQSVDDLQLFDIEKLKTYFWYYRLKKGKVKQYKKEGFTPKYFTDSFSMIYFLRGMPLKIRDIYEFPVMTRTKMWLFKAEVLKVDEIEIMGKDVAAYKVKVETRFPGVLKKKGDIFIWFSKDRLKKLLKFEAKVKIGTVKGTLIDYQKGSL